MAASSLRAKSKDSQDAFACAYHDYRYVKFEMKYGTRPGYATFSILHFRIPGKNNKNELVYFHNYKFGVAFCSPHDIFKKSIGRNLANIMLNGGWNRAPIMGASETECRKGYMSLVEFDEILKKAILLKGPTWIYNTTRIIYGLDPFAPRICLDSLRLPDDAKKRAENRILKY